MTQNKKQTASEPEYPAREIPGRELEHFVQLLWQGNIDKTFSYAHRLISGGVHPSVITLEAAKSYFPFAYGAKEQEKRAIKIAERFSNKPFYWKDSFIDNGFYESRTSQDIKDEEKK